MKLKDIVPTFRYSTIDYLNESLLLTEHVFSMIDDIDVRLKQNGLNDVEAIRILAGLLLFVRMNQGSGGVVGINSLLHDDPQSGESLGTISKLQTHYPQETADNVKEIQVAIKKGSVYNVIRTVRGFFERRSGDEEK